MHITRRKLLKSTIAATAASASGLNLAMGSELGAGASKLSKEHPQGYKWANRNPKKKPNILIAILDDVGFADLGCFGAEHKTSCIDQLASEGTKFNNFHVTALCAPTRACLLTGRNAHAVGVGNIAEWGRDLPGYQGWVRQDAATLAEMLKPAGYTNLAIGKWHLSAIDDQNATGPFDLWPIGRGFDRWYGFHGNAMDHFHPELFENNVAAYPDKSAAYHLSEDLVEHGIQYIQDHLVAAPENPFFMYLAFGACHYPHHAPDEYIDRQKGSYDQGWDKLRAERYKTQQQLGVIPAHAKLSPRSENVQAWDSLSNREQRIAVRGQEVYSAFIEHTDDQLQKLISFLAAEDQLDDTIVLVLSDNGASAGGSKLGTLDLRRNAYLDLETTDHLEKYLDQMGSEDSQAQYGIGWAHASNTPLKWYKGDTYGGGTRSPLIVRWPHGDIEANGLRNQYHHAIDVVPSLLEMANVPFPHQVNGQEALPIQGDSFAYSFDHSDAPTSKQIQYFETSGDRAIWAGGWKAVVRHTAGTSFDEDVWELFQTESDFSEIDNRADDEPELLEEMIGLWHEEALRYDVLPMNDDLLTLYQQCLPAPRARHVFYRGMTRLDRLSAPDIYHFNSQITADVEMDSNTANGVLLASGDGSMGYEIYLKNGYLYFTYIYTRERVYRLKSTKRIPSGKHLLSLAIEKTGEDSAIVEMACDGDSVGRLAMPKIWPIYAPNSGIRCGENSGAPISKDYSGDFAFDQTLNRVIVDVDI